MFSPAEPKYRPHFPGQDAEILAMDQVASGVNVNVDIDNFDSLDNP